jgi:hypothetical protein
VPPSRAAEFEALETVADRVTAADCSEYAVSVAPTSVRLSALSMVNVPLARVRV